jgi:hypothetical protein
MVSDPFHAQAEKIRSFLVVVSKKNNNIIASSLDVHKSFFPELCSLAVSTFKPFEQRF